MDIRQAVERWIKAEWAFRLGPHAYTDVVTKLWEDAQEDLREALTGERGLWEAAEHVHDGKLPGVPPLFSGSAKAQAESAAKVKTVRKVTKVTKVRRVK